jgi:hypothetical protein
MGLRIGETFRQQRAVAEAVAPLLGQRSHGGGQTLAGEIGGTAFGGEQEEAAVLDDELEPLQALIGTPGNPAVAILERVTRRSPHQQGDGLAGALDDLAQVIANGSARAEEMLRGELLIERGELVGHRHVHGERRLGRQRRHLG